MRDSEKYSVKNELMHAHEAWVRAGLVKSGLLHMVRETDKAVRAAIARGETQFTMSAAPQELLDVLVEQGYELAEGKNGTYTVYF